MSIAVSVVVKPSRFLLTMVGCMCVAIIFVAIMLGLEKFGELPKSIRLLVITVCIFSAFSAFYWTIWKRKTFHIDISGGGQIRLIEDNGLAGLVLPQQGSSHRSNGKVVRLMADSTCWSSLLLLRLQDENQQITVLPILRDCVTRNGFRALSVACRWIAAHNIQADDKLSD